MKAVDFDTLKALSVSIELCKNIVTEVMGDDVADSIAGEPVSSEQLTNIIAMKIRNKIQTEKGI